VKRKQKEQTNRKRNSPAFPALPFFSPPLPLSVSSPPISDVFTKV
jgi:hypothetical protein